MQNPIRLYQRPLAWTNIAYLVTQINKPGYKELDYPVLEIEGLSCNPKIIVFAVSINKKIMLGKNLWFCLLEKLRSRGKTIFRSFSSDLEPKTKID